MNLSSLFRKLKKFSQSKKNLSHTSRNLICENELIGKWSVNVPKSLKDISLEIFSEGTGKYNTKPLKSILPQRSPNQLIMKDHFGYSLILEKKENEKYYLFDELDGITYAIEKIIKN